MDKMNISTTLILLIGGVLLYIFEVVDFFPVFFAIIIFLNSIYRIRQLMNFEKKDENENKIFEKNSTLFILQLIFLLIVFGLRIIGLMGKSNSHLLVFFEFAIVLLFMNSINIHLINKEKKTTKRQQGV